jgi:hypothetical protein
MAAKKKSKKRPMRAKKASGKKVKRVKKLAKRKATPVKKSAKKKAVKKKAAAKSTVSGKKTVGTKTLSARKRHAPKKGRPDNIVSFTRESSRARSGGQSGDLQGLSNMERANSESVDELLEEGNAFEAEAVAGVENAGNADEEEVHTHEVPEDDVPAEYLDKD